MKKKKEKKKNASEKPIVWCDVEKKTIALSIAVTFLSPIMQTCYSRFTRQHKTVQSDEGNKDKNLNIDICKCINSWTKCNEDRSIHPSIRRTIVHSIMHWFAHFTNLSIVAFIFPSFQFLISFLSVLWSTPFSIPPILKSNCGLWKVFCARLMDSVLCKMIIENQVIAKIWRTIADYHRDLHYNNNCREVLCNEDLAKMSFT